MSVVWLRWLKCGLPIGVLFVIGQGLIWFGIVGLAIGAVAWLTGFGDFWGDPGAPQGPIKKWGAWVILIGALVFGARKGWQEGIDFKVWLATSSKRFRRYREEKEFGKGGSSAFAGVVEDWRHRWYSGDVLLGKSLNEAFWWVGWQDDRGFLTVAGRRSGIPCSMRTQAQSCGMI